MAVLSSASCRSPAHNAPSALISATLNRQDNRFLADAANLGIDLDDTLTIPKPLSAELWPGAETAFTSLAGLRVP